MPVREAHLLHELILVSAARTPDALALTAGSTHLRYVELADQVRSFSQGLMGTGLARASRVGIYLDKRIETVVGSFGAPAAGMVFVPMNPLLKPEQVGFIMADCAVSVLLTSPERYALLHPTLAQGSSLKHIVLTEGAAVTLPPPPEGVRLYSWAEFMSAPACAGHRVIDTDIVAILYTSGSTGRPKGVVLSHRNMVAGAKSVASYLENHAQDTLLAALPLSFDAGFSQLTTAFHSGARVVLLNYLMPRDVLKAMEREKVTG
ncbi:MAG: AMP-binding protein, partial [Paucibacter sp.]|nr:AMP-binding protein [Roseateles sp.]